MHHIFHQRTEPWLPQSPGSRNSERPPGAGALTDQIRRSCLAQDPGIAEPDGGDLDIGRV